METLKSLIKHDKNLAKKLIRSFKDDAFSDDQVLIIGLDEVGRGCLAGPVCTGAYGIWASGLALRLNKTELGNLIFLNDSKKVRADKREALCDDLKKKAETYYFSNFKEAKQIDKIGIVPSIWESMKENLRSILKKIPKKNFPKLLIVLVDGPHKIPGLEIEFLAEFKKKGLSYLEQTTIVKGDSKSMLIAAASNIAKFSRDSYMWSLAEEYPDYSWDTNVGYGTLIHRKVIKEKGITDLHRKSFLGKILLES